MNAIVDTTTEETFEVSAPCIASSAVYADLSISVWTGIKLDKAATRQTLTANGADSEMGNFRKKLLGNCAELDAVQKYAANTRNWHYGASMPWGMMGQRLLPTTTLPDYIFEITQHEREFWRLVTDFLGVYEWAQTSAQAKLVGLWNADDYPSVESLRTKFKFHHAQIKIPEDSTDWRLKVGADTQQYLKEQYRKHYSEQLHNAMGDVWQRTYKALQNMSEKLDYKSSEDKDTRKIFRDSLVGNVHDMLGLLVKFNITGDAKMEAMRIQLEDAMTGVSADALREDDVFRLDTKKKIDAIRSSMTW